MKTLPTFVAACQLTIGVGSAASAGDFGFHGGIGGHSPRYNLQSRYPYNQPGFGGYGRDCRHRPGYGAPLGYGYRPPVLPRCEYHVYLQRPCGTWVCGGEFDRLNAARLAAAQLRVCGYDARVERIYR